MSSFSPQTSRYNVTQADYDALELLLVQIQLANINYQLQQSSKIVDIYRNQFTTKDETIANLQRQISQLTPRVTSAKQEFDKVSAQYKALTDTVNTNMLKPVVAQFKTKNSTNAKVLAEVKRILNKFSVEAKVLLREYEPVLKESLV